MATEGAASRFDAGTQISLIARRIYDPDRRGTVVNRDSGNATALAQTATLLVSRAPIFEAGFAAGGVLAFADVLVPVDDHARRWRIVAVKSSTQVKDHHLDDIAVQSFAANRSGLSVSSVAVAHVDSSWTYAGDGDYSGLLKETDVRENVAPIEAEVADWILEAAQISRAATEPDVETGSHCDSPFSCSYFNHCSAREYKARHPISWLPGAKSARLKEAIVNGAKELADLDDAVLNEMHQRVKTHTLSGSTYFDAQAAAAELAAHPLPATFLDFETINFAVPVWRGTRPYQQIPFQFSLHKLDGDERLHHREFLDVGGNDPSRPFADGAGSVGEPRRFERRKKWVFLVRLAAFANHRHGRPSEKREITSRRSLTA